MGSTLCKPYFYFLRTICTVCQKNCILSVFARTFRQRWPKFTFNITFAFHYLQEFGNDRSELEGVFNQRKSFRFQSKPPILTLNSIVETSNRTCSSCKEQKIGDLDVYMKLYASDNLRKHVLWYFSQWPIDLVTVLRKEIEQ